MSEKTGPSKRSIYIRAALFVVFLAGVVALRWTPLIDYLDEERLLALFAELRQTWWAPLGLVGLQIVVATTGLPVSPTMLVGGAVFGFVQGWLLNTVGLVLGGTVSFFLVKLLGRDFVVHVFGDKLYGVERMFSKHSLWALIQVRFMPLPYSMVNFAAALAGVRPLTFILATFIGMVPATLVHTYFIASIFEQRGHRLVVLAQYIGVLILFNAAISAPKIRTWWRSRHAAS